jgi:hypothetical protein
MIVVVARGREKQQYGGNGIPGGGGSEAGYGLEAYRQDGSTSNQASANQVREGGAGLRICKAADVDRLVGMPEQALRGRIA